MGINPLNAVTGNIQSAIAVASQKTGIDFNYLLGQAQVESGLRANARAHGSSATGLYQFIDQSWLKVIKQHGADHGLGWAADAIQPGANGRLTVSDPETRQQILNLRSDPQISAIMAAEHAADNKTAIEEATGRQATGTDLYMAHFLGLGGARSFLTTLASSPDRIGAAMFPAAARANRSIFYSSDGQPRTLSDIYQNLAARLDKGAAAVGATGLASATLTGAPTGVDGPIGKAQTLLAALTTGGGDVPTVIAGNGEASASSALNWAQATLNQLNSGGRTVTAAANGADSILRPTPKLARLAYMMLAGLGA
ncbi:MAG: lytic transglycosylase domain-containing protein [Sphingomonas sp.]